MTAEPATASVPASPQRRSVRAGLTWPEIWSLLVALAAVGATIAMFVRGPGSAGLFVPILCLIAVGLGAGFDAATGRIPNAITYTSILLGLFINSIAVLLQTTWPAVAAHWLGAAGPTQSALGLLVFGGIGLVSFLVKGMGGGDMKQIAAVGAMLGLSRATDALLCAMVIAVLNALLNLFLAGRLNATLRAAASQLLDLFILKELHPEPARLGHKRIPLAVPIFLGVLLAQVPAITRATAWVYGG